MTFAPRQYTQILDDMISFVEVNSTLTDYTVGSVVRTILEAAALEDDEQYFQMIQLLDAFSLRSSSGTELDGRLSDYGIVRLQPTSASGKVLILDGKLATDTLAFDANAAATTVLLESTLKFPTTGFPYNIRLGEGATSVEEVSVSANNTGSAALTIAPLTNNHSIGERVSLVTGSADTIISAGVKVQVPAQGDQTPTAYNTLQSGVIVNGNYSSNPIATKAVLPGIAGNLGPSRISQFSASPPFSGALVTNDVIFTGGRAVESDADAIDRALLHLQSLGKGTPLALREAVLGVTDPLTGQRVSTASVLERFSDREVIIYVDDGSGFIPDQVALPRDVLASSLIVGASTFAVVDASDFPSEGYVLISPESAQSEVVHYISVDYLTDTLTLDGTTANAHDAADEVVTVEVITPSSDPGIDFFTLEKWPTVRSTQNIWLGPSPSNLTLQSEGTDYYFNKARSKIEFLTAVPTGSYLVCTYTYYIGLIFQAQRFVNGSYDDEIAFPGVVAAGIQAVVETPAIRRITVRMSITGNAGYDEATLAPSVRAAVENYIVALGIGEDFIVAEAIERAMGVAGMYNVLMQEPTSDLSVASNELPVPVSAAGNSLVTVS